MIRQLLDMYRERHDFFLRLTLEHLALSGISVLIACVAGLCLGIVVSEYRKTSSVITGVVNFIYTIPSISLLGFLIPFSGIGNGTAVIALTVYALLPMVRNTHSGLNDIDPDILEAATAMGSTRWQILARVKLPLAFPTILAGLRNMVVMTISLAGIASFIGAGGLGVAIYRGITTNNSAMVVAGSLLIAFLALFFDYLLGGLEKIVVMKRRSDRSSGASWRGPALALCGVAALAALVFRIAAPAGGAMVHIATKPMTEQLILGEMLSQIIYHDTDLAVKITHGVGGGTANIHPALVKGEFDLYPEYSGTAWAYVLKKTALPDEAALRRELAEEYRKQFDLEWVGMYGFNNTYGLAVRKGLAEEHGIVSYSDLAPLSSELVFGAEYDFFERDDGYRALCGKYGFAFRKTMDLDIGVKYRAIDAGEIDVMVVFTTDGQLSAADLVVLEDDGSFFPNYFCGTVVRRDALERHPELRESLLKMTDLIWDRDMAAMNYQVEAKGRDAKEVARDFLRERKVIP